MIQEKTRERQGAQFSTDADETFLDDPERWATIAGNELFIVRKQTISHANEELNKKLSKQYQLSKLDYRRKSALLKDQKQRVTYEYENYPEKKEMYFLRQMFAKQSKSNQLMKEDHQKIKKRVQKISKATQLQDNLSLKQGQIARYTIKMASDIPSLPKPQPRTEALNRGSVATQIKMEHPHQR